MSSFLRFRPGVLPVVLAGLLLILVTLVELQRGLINHDVAGHLVAARQVLEGESLYTDFLEMNPPLIVGTYLPAAVAAAATPISQLLAARLLVILLVACCLALSWPLLGFLLVRSPPWQVVAARIGLLPVLLWLPGAEFGQREHLHVVLVLPYLLAMAVTLSPGLPRPGPWLRGMAAVLAAVGFCLKPHFLLIWLVMEGARLLVVRRPAGMLRWESLLVAGLATAYGLAVILATPAYLTRIVPLLWQTYWAYQEPMSGVVAQPWLLIPVAAMLAWALAGRRHGTPTGDLLLAWIAAGLAVFFLQGKGWTYHALPAVAAGALLLGWLSLQGGRDRFRAVVTILMTVMVTAGFSWGAWRGFQRQIFRLEHGEVRDLTLRLDREAAGLPVMFVSSSQSWSMPAVIHSRAVWGSSYPQLWPIPALVQMSGSEDLQNEVLGRLAADLEQRRPRLVLIQKGSYPRRFGGRAFDWEGYLRRHAPLDAILDRDYLPAGETRLHRIYRRR